MSRILMQFTIGALSVLLSFALYAEEAKPKIVFQEKYFDFGRVGKYEHLKHVFTFANEGQAILVIQNIEKSCSCIATPLGPKEIAPNKKGKIEVKLSTGSKERKVTGLVAVYSNDPENSKVVLGIRADVRPDVDITPPEVYFHNVPSGNGFERTIKIFIPKGIDVKLEKVESSSPYIEAKLVKASQDVPEDFQIKINIKPNTPIGQFHGQIALTTSSARWKVVRIPVIGTITGEIECFPPRIFFGIVKKGSDVFRKTKITIHTEKPIKVLKVESDSPFVSVGVEPADEGKKYLLTASLIADAPVGMQFGNVTIYTNSDQQPKLRIPFSALIRNK